MKSGKLNRRIVIERSTQAVNDFGTPGMAWTPHATLRAEVLTETAKEYLDRRGTTDVAAVVFRTRHLAGVTTSDRVAWRGTNFNIREVVTMEGDRTMELRCEAQNGGAA